MTTEQKMKIIHHPGPDPQRGWSRKGAETTAKLYKQNAAGAPEGELLDEKVTLSLPRYGSRSDTLEGAL